MERYVQKKVNLSYSDQIKNRKITEKCLFFFKKSIKSVDLFSSVEKKKGFVKEEKVFLHNFCPFKLCPDDGIIPICIFPLIRKGKLEALQTSILNFFPTVKDKLACSSEEIKTSFPPAVLQCQPFASSTLGKFSLLEQSRSLK